jgi:hypothetical protein
MTLTTHECCAHTLLLKYPFDEQECKLVVSTYSMSNQEINLVAASTGVVDLTYLDSFQVVILCHLFKISFFFHDV